MFSIKVLIFLTAVAACMHCGNCLFGGGDNFLFPFILGTLTCNGGFNSLGGHGSSKCPDGWLKFKGHCYYFSKDTKNWFEAQQICRSLGGALVQIDSEKENDFIVAEAKRLEDGADDDWYIGANSLANQNEFVWEFTQKTVPLPGDKKFEDWADGLPQFNAAERCVEIEPEEDFQWTDDECTEMEFYICEKCPGCKAKATLECH